MSFHPLLLPYICNASSRRLVPLHKPFSIAPNNDFLPDFDEKVRKLNDQVEQWTEYWDNYQKARGVPEGDLLREGCKSCSHLLSPIGCIAYLICSDHRGGGNYTIYERSDTTRYQTKKRRDGIVGRETSFPHQGCPSRREYCQHVSKESDCELLLSRGFNQIRQADCDGVG